jgi:hypothetical protein
MLVVTHRSMCGAHAPHERAECVSITRTLLQQHEARHCTDVVVEHLRHVQQPATST